MIDRPKWFEAPVNAPSGAKCTMCGLEVTGKNYIWRSVYQPLGEKYEYAHRACIMGEGTYIKQVLQV